MKIKQFIEDFIADCIIAAMIFFVILAVFACLD